MKIAHKFILALMLGALMIWGVGIFAARESRRALGKAIEGSSATFARQILDSVDRTIYERIEDTQSYATNLVLRQAVARSNGEFEQIDDVEAYIDRMDREWTSTPKGTLSPLMKDLLGRMVSREMQERFEFYEKKRGGSPFVEMFVTNKFGAVVGLTGRTTDYRQNDEEWWQRAREDGVFIGDVMFDESTGTYAIDVAVRIDDGHCSFIGVFIAVLGISEFTEIVSPFQREYHGHNNKPSHYWLLTGDGRVIYSTDDIEPLGVAPDHLLPHCRINEGHGRCSAHCEVHGDTFVVYAHSNGFRDFKGLGWTLQIAHEPEVIFASADLLRKRIQFFALGVTIVGLVGGWFCSRNISRRFTRLINATVEIGDGDLDARVNTGGSDELGRLGAHFNGMAEKLRQSRDELRESGAELRDFNRLAVGRELRMIELKREVNEMAVKAGIEPPYDLTFETAQANGAQGIGTTIPSTNTARSKE